MPVTVNKKAGVYRIVEAGTGKISRTAKGTPVDGGGHRSEMRATNQARAINANLVQKRKQEGHRHG
jgi:hypothetical protein